MRKTNKNGGKKKEGELPKSLPSFLFFLPLLSLFGYNFIIFIFLIFMQMVVENKDKRGRKKEKEGRGIYYSLHFNINIFFRYREKIISL